MSFDIFTHTFGTTSDATTCDRLLQYDSFHFSFVVLRHRSNNTLELLPQESLEMLQRRYRNRSRSRRMQYEGLSGRLLYCEWGKRSRLRKWEGMRHMIRVTIDDPTLSYFSEVANDSTHYFPTRKTILPPRSFSPRTILKAAIFSAPPSSCPESIVL